MRSQVAIFSCLVLAAGVSTAETQRQLTSHEHAAQKINFAIQEDQLYLELFAPANDVVGFEHLPSTPEQKQAVQQVIEDLEHNESIFVISPKAGCQLQTAHTEWIGDKEHEEHEEHEDDAGHAEFQAKYQFICSSIDALKEIEVGVFNLYPSVQRIDVQGVLNEGQMAVTLRPDSNKIALKP